MRFKPENPHEVLRLYQGGASILGLAKACSVSALTMERFLSDQVEDALKALPARDAKVLRLYFGLDGGREHTLEEIGGMLGVTRERVRQLRDRALKRLREGDVGRALASFAA